jgi:protocatechuate 3,4-dioxygenase beta subunit
MTSPSRRTLLIGGGLVAAGAGAFVATRAGVLSSPDNTALEPVAFSFEDSPQCVLTAFVEEGPFYIDEALVRSDVREGRKGVETKLQMKIVDGATCKALPGAAVDIWHCDAEGGYSAGSERFLRGRQIAGDDGIVGFTTIFPGWYPGRAPHIHVKIYLEKTVVSTTQLFFPNELSREIYANAPYAGRGQPRTTNDNDGILSEAEGANGGWPKMAKTPAGLAGSLTIGVKRA